MMRLTIFLVSMFAMASVVFAVEPAENPGRPFERVLQGLDQANEKLDGNLQAILDTGRDLRDLAGGATHWTSPHWVDFLRSEPILFDELTLVHIVNTSFLFTAVVDMNVYDNDGVLDAQRSSHFNVPPRGRRVRSLQLPTDGDKDFRGWLEVVSDRNVFVEGDIIVRSFFAGGTNSRADRTMTWYRADSEADSE